MGRVELHGVGSIMHVIKRGTRGVKIVCDDEDRSQFVRSLFYLNEIYREDNWKRNTNGLTLGERPAHWPAREPLVRILAWTLMSNHFHLILQETREKGIAKFMQRLCNSMSKSFNEKYKEKGSLFQSSYKAKTVHTDAYLHQLVWYVHVKNVLELCPGGLEAAIKDFNKAWDWGLQYPYSSLSMHALGVGSPIIEDAEKMVHTAFEKKTFKKEAKEFLLRHIRSRSEEFKSLILEEW